MEVELWRRAGVVEASGEESCSGGGSSAEPVAQLMWVKGSGAGRHKERAGHKGKGRAKGRDRPTGGRGGRGEQKNTEEERNTEEGQESEA